MAALALGVATLKLFPAVTLHFVARAPIGGIEHVFERLPRGLRGCGLDDHGCVDLEIGHGYLFLSGQFLQRLKNLVGCLQVLRI